MLVFKLCTEACDPSNPHRCQSISIVFRMFCFVSYEGKDSNKNKDNGGHYHTEIEQTLKSNYKTSI